MSKRDIGFLLSGIVLVVVFRIVMGMSRPPQALRIAGQEAPSNVFQFDFAKRYKINCGSGYGAETPVIYEDVKFMGFSGNSGQPKGSLYSYDYFDRWIVLELRDLRKVFLPINSIRIIEEMPATGAS